MNKKTAAFLCLSIALLMTCGAVCASVPSYVSYQGKLTDDLGNPINGTRSLTFELYDDEKVGSLLWTETQSNVQITNGLFTVLLGSVTPLPDSAFTGITYLQTSVGGTVLTPRVRIVSAGYALRAKKAEEVVPPLTLSSTIATPDSVMSVSNSGTGVAANLRSQHGTALKSVTAAASGTGAYFGVDNTSSTASSLQSLNSALGMAGEFSVFNASNTSPALYAYTSGMGPALRAQTSGSGMAGELLGSAYVSGNLGVGTSFPTSRLDVLGTAQMTGFKLTTSPTAGYVLKSDASGAGTWQADSVALPFSAITNSASDLFWLRNSGTGGAIYVNTQGAGDGIYALASGTGKAGSFTVNNSGSSSNAVHASSNGSGSAVNAINTGVGRAGNFEINNGSSSATALRAHTNGSGDALYASASGSGRAGVFSGDVHITGDLTFPAGRPNIPIAYGIINSDGTKRAGTTNVSSSWDAANQWYVITISGVSYSNLTHVAVANVVGLASPRVAMTSSSSGRLVVTLYDLNGTASQGMFGFVVYEP